MLEETNKRYDPNQPMLILDSARSHLTKKTKAAVKQSSK